MTVVRLRMPDGDDDLARRARRGDARAHRLLVRRHAPRVLELTRLAAGGRSDVSELAARALAAGLADPAPLDTALVRAVVHVTRAHLDKLALASLVILLTDVEGRSESTVADLLGRDVTEIADLRAAGRQSLDLAVERSRHCRGWPLAAARDRVTDAERSAADGHLLVCRSCAARLRERDRARQRLIARSAAMTGAVGEVVAFTLGSTGTAFGGAGAAFGGLASGKVAAAVIGAAAIAVATTSGAVAGARLHEQPAHHQQVERPGASHVSTADRHNRQHTTPHHKYSHGAPSSPSPTHVPRR